MVQAIGIDLSKTASFHTYRRTIIISENLIKIGSLAYCKRQMAES